MIDRTPYFLALKEALDKSEWVRCGPKDYERAYVHQGYKIRCIEDVHEPGSFTVSVEGTHGQRVKIDFKDDDLMESAEEHAQRNKDMNRSVDRWDKPHVHMSTEAFVKKVKGELGAKGIHPIVTHDPSEKARREYRSKFGQLPSGQFDVENFVRSLVGEVSKYNRAPVDGDWVADAAVVEKQAEEAQEAPEPLKARKRSEVSK